MTQITVLLVATEWNPTYENCISTLRKQEFKYQVLGFGEKWQGWKWRTELYTKALRCKHPDDLIILLDAYDTLCQKHSSTFYTDFLSFNKDIVIGCEWYCGNTKNCANVDAWWNYNKFTTQPTRKYINAGCIAGKAHALLAMYKSFSEEDDQLALAQWVNKFPEKCALDYGSWLVYTSHIFDLFKTPSTSYFLHYPGPLLKLGVFPRYNKDVKDILSVRGRNISGPEWVSAIKFLLMLVCSSILLYKLV